MIRVLVVDDHPVLRVGLSQLLEEADDISLVGLAEDGKEALRPPKESSSGTSDGERAMSTTAQICRRLVTSSNEIEPNG